MNMATPTSELFTQGVRPRAYQRVLLAKQKVRTLAALNGLVASLVLRHNAGYPINWENVRTALAVLQDEVNV